MTFGLWELAKHRDFQDKLRAEINETLAKVKARGDSDFTANDFESMPYLVAFTKVRRSRLFNRSLIGGEVYYFLTQESLRIHPIAVDIERTPIQDDILPLTKPIIGTSGRVYTELPVPKGTAVTISTIGYNLYIFCPKPSPRCSALTIVLVAEIRVCGVQTLMSFDRSAGSKWTNRWSRLLVWMGTCTVTHGVLKESMSIDLSSTQLYILRRC